MKRTTISSQRSESNKENKDPGVVYDQVVEFDLRNTLFKGIYLNLNNIFSELSTQKTVNEIASVSKAIIKTRYTLDGFLAYWEKIKEKQQKAKGVTLIQYTYELAVTNIKQEENDYEYEIIPF